MEGREIVETYLGSTVITVYIFRTCYLPDHSANKHGKT